MLSPKIIIPESDSCSRIGWEKIKFLFLEKSSTYIIQNYFFRGNYNSSNDLLALRNASLLDYH